MIKGDDEVQEKARCCCEFEVEVEVEVAFYWLVDTIHDANSKTGDLRPKRRRR